MRWTMTPATVTSSLPVFLSICLALNALMRLLACAWGRRVGAYKRVVIVPLVRGRPLV